MLHQKILQHNVCKWFCSIDSWWMVKRLVVWWNVRYFGTADRRNFRINWCFAQWNAIVYDSSARSPDSLINSVKLLAVANLLVQGPKWRKPPNFNDDHAQVVSAHLVSAQMTRSCAPARPWRDRRGVDLRHCGLAVRVWSRQSNELSAVNAQFMSKSNGCNINNYRQVDMATCRY